MKSRLDIKFRKSHSKFGIKLVTQFLDFWHVVVYHART